MDGSKTVAPQWPASPEQLSDPYLCPVCFTGVRPPLCPTCGFDFSDPRAGRILSMGRELLQLETERRQMIEAVQLSAAIEARRVARVILAAERATLAKAEDAAAAAALLAVAAPSPALDAGELAALSATSTATAPVLTAGDAIAPAAAPVAVEEWPPPAQPPDPSGDEARQPRRRLTV